MIYLVVVAILSVTFFRPLLLVTFPLFVLCYFFLFKAKNTQSSIVIIALAFLVTLIGSVYVGEVNISNNILSFYLIIPLILVFFSRIKIHSDKYFTFFMKALTVILIMNNLVALLQLIQNPTDDDAFIGIYGLHGLGLHTLSIINFMMSVYYFFTYQSQKKISSIVLFLFFLVSAVLCFYGLGLVVFLVSIFVYRFSLRTLFKSLFIFAFVLVLMGGSLYFIKKQTFLYNYENIKRIGLFFSEQSNSEKISLIPRKLLVYRAYINGYVSDPGLFLLGSGPGTFNSRSYFLLNGDYSDNKAIETIFGYHNPKYATEYVYPLWNSDNFLRQYMDGTRNEPFSSIIAMLAEYGLIVSFIVAALVYTKYKRHIRRYHQKKSSHYEYFKFISIFFALNLFTDNFLEYPEIAFLFVLIFSLLTSTDTASLSSEPILIPKNDYKEN